MAAPVFLLMVIASFAQGDSRRSARPAPRWPDGTINLGAPLGEAGTWEGQEALATGPRSLGTAYGVELLNLPGSSQYYLFVIGGPHTFRVIYMDGRTHPLRLEPGYFGHSIGWWEGWTGLPCRIPTGCTHSSD
ncbi:MAG: hypothetical protein ABW292_05095 [Vicinamibacterales bacterium]